MTHRFLPLLVIVAALSKPAYAAADIVFSNLTPPDNSFNRVAGYGINNNPLLPPVIPAVAFTPADDFTLTQIDVPLSYTIGTDSFILSLDSSSGGLPDGTIESWTLTGLPLGLINATLQTVTPDMLVSLVSGTQYWLVASPTTDDTLGAWNFSLTDTTSPFAQNFGFGFNLVGEGAPRPAFAVLGNPVGNEVPEPTSLVLLAIGIVGIVGMALRRHVHPVK